LKKSNPQNRNLEKTSKFQLKQARKQETRKSSNKTPTPQKHKLEFAGKPQVCSVEHFRYFCKPDPVQKFSLSDSIRT